MFNKWEMVSELLCTTHKNATDLACGRLWMERKAKAMNDCLINDCPCSFALSVSSALFRTTGMGYGESTLAVASDGNPCASVYLNGKMLVIVGGCFCSSGLV